MSGFPAPADVLPHRSPFLFLDEVTEVDPGRSAKGWWRMTGEEAFFAGHFPGRPTLPGVLMAEAVAQLGAYVLLRDGRFGEKLPLFGGVDRMRFRRQVVPGELVELRIEMVRVSARAGRASGSARVGDEVACEGGILFVLVDR